MLRGSSLKLPSHATTILQQIKKVFLVDVFLVDVFLVDAFLAYD